MCSSYPGSPGQRLKTSDTHLGVAITGGYFSHWADGCHEALDILTGDDCSSDNLLRVAHCVGKAAPACCQGKLCSGLCAVSTSTLDGDNDTLHLPSGGVTGCVPCFSK